jgi:glutathione S-transferase
VVIDAGAGSLQLPFRDHAKEDDMPTVYGVQASPYVRKVRIFLAEKGIAYDLDPVIPFNVSDEYRKLSPLGKVPAFRDGDRTLSDSSVICAYVERTHPEPPLYPRDPYEYARALWFEEYGDGGLAPVIGPKIFFQRIVGPRFFGSATDEEIVQKAIQEELPPLLDYLDGQLDGGDAFVGGRFSIGDIGIVAQLVNLRHAGVDVDARRWPKLAHHFASACARPSVKSLLDEESASLGGTA